MRTGNQDDQAGLGRDTATSGLSSRRVGLALFGLVILILIAGFYLSRRLRPTVDETVVAVPARSQGSTTKLAHGTEPASTPPSSSPAVASVSPTASPEAAVRQAYLRYWNVYANALYTLDTSRLAEVTAGDELIQARQAVNNLQTQHHAAKIEIEHHIAVVSLAQSQAVIQDEYLNRSYLVDATTKQALQTPNSGQTENISCQLSLQNGIWKVVKVTRINETITHQGT